MTHITTTLFDFFKTGPGPSSSHTIGPMKAGYDFSRLCATLADEDLRQAARFQIRLFGSLSATGQGHGTPAAVVAGLLGTAPEQCPASLLQRLTSQPGVAHPVRFGGGGEVPVCVDQVIFDAVIHPYPYSNTLIIDLLDREDHLLASREYYSVGGGFIQWKGYVPPERGQAVHIYQNMAELKALMHETGLALHEVLMENEMAITGASRPAILHELDRMLASMEASVQRGLDAEGLLPGPLGVERKARMIRDKALRLAFPVDRFLADLNAYAFATSEENASGGVIVTAPTCGASGVMPALVYAMRHDHGIGDRALREGLLAAAAVGFLAKHNASIAGAEVGCQGEVGVASAMAAALYANARGSAPQVVENAAEVALEHHLGLTCDPVQGYVQIPCIERNAVGAVKAYNAALLTRCMNPGSQRVSLDTVIHAMADTGRQMSDKFKETSLGGLAVSMVEC